MLTHLIFEAAKRSHPSEKKLRVRRDECCASIVRGATDPPSIVALASMVLEDEGVSVAPPMTHPPGHQLVDIDTSTSFSVR